MKKFMNIAVLGFAANMCRMAVGDDECANVDGFSKPNADIMKEIAEEEAARVRTEQKNAAKNQVKKDSYAQEYNAIELRYKRAEAEAQAERLKAMTKENKNYNEGGVDTDEHRKNLEKIEDEYRTALDKAHRERSKALDNLRTKNPDGYNRYRGW